MADWALVIGINKYDRLRYTDVIQAFQRIFQRQGQPTPPPQPEPVTTQSGAKSQATPLKTTEPEVELLSEKKVDYTRLRNLLADGKWKEADEETFAVMLKAAGREGYLNIESIETFPCADLRTIDHLWVKYSDGRFGFSVQKRIWESVVRESVGLKPSEYYYGMEFPERIGWSVKKEWLFESDLTYGENAPEGHLPTYCMLDGHGWEFTRETISSIALRLVSCNI